MDVITVVQQLEKQGYTHKHSGWVRDNKITICRYGKRRDRVYDMRRIGGASGKRLQRLLNNDVIEKRVEFDDAELSVTVYFFF
jgi:hypothetical protein